MICKKEFEMILSGTKKTEWRSPSVYNKKLLFCPDEKFNGKLNGNPKVTEITFQNGYSKNSPKLTIECLSIRMIKFSQDIKIPEDNFEALKGMFAIEIKLGKIIK